MPFNQQHYTYYKVEAVESFIKKVLTEAAELFQSHFNQGETAALILIGGYGRGEGGVVYENETYRPHNNLDLLYIHHGSIAQERIDRVNQVLQEISETYGIGIDLSAIKQEKLLSLKGMVIGYDMRFGHRTLLGDSSFLKEHNAFSLYNIDPVDVRQLLVNRGTLLLINRLLLQKETPLSLTEKKLVIKHAVKAIIGYGDALLYFHNQYNWSYARKLTNMQKLTGVSEPVKSLYAEAMLFRFKPDYAKYLEKDLKSWNNELLETLASIHLQCEQINLSETALEWESYFATALNKKSFAKQSMKQQVKSLVQGIKNVAVVKELDSLRQISSFMQLGGKGMLGLLFPYIAYERYPEHYKGVFVHALHTENSSGKALLNSFLNLWSHYGDTNFKNVLRTYHITLEK